jgi:hypothetical protein
MVSACLNEDKTSFLFGHPFSSQAAGFFCLDL